MAQTNADKLIKRINDAAREEADAILAAADAECERIRLIAENDVFELEGEAHAKMLRTREGILERSRTNAALDSRKYALKTRRDLVDEAFASAYKALLSLEGSERRELISKLIIEEAEGGEAVCPAKGDVATVAAVLENVNKALKASARKTVTLGDACDEEGGFILRAEGYEKNCAFRALIRDVRTECESEVAGMLFGK